MTHYKLTYFPLRGRAEIIRFVFAAAGVEYEDHRLQAGQWWLQTGLWSELKKSKSSMNASRFCFFFKFDSSIRYSRVAAIGYKHWEIHNIIALATSCGDECGNR